MKNSKLKTKYVSLIFVGLLLSSTFSQCAYGLSSSSSMPGNTGYEPWYYYIAGMVCSANGNLYFSEKDISIKARGFDIEIIRHYNSYSSGVNSPFGFGWTFNYNVYLVENQDGSVTLYDGDGSVHTFTKSDGNTYTAPPGIHSKLIKKPDGFVLRFKDGSSYNFDTDGKLVSIIDKNDNKLTFTYADGKLVRVSDDSGLYLSFTYENNRITSITDPLGRQIKYEYDAGDLVKVTDAMGNSTLYFYYENHKLQAVVNRVDSVLLFSYYGDGRVKAIKKSQYDRSKGKYLLPFTLFSFVYDDQTNTVYVTDAMGHTTEIEVNDRGNPVKITDALGGTTTMSWDNDMNLISVTDANGHTTNYEYDSYGNLIRETDPTGSSTFYNWQTIDSDTTYISLLLNTTNVRGFTTTYEYDEKGNLVKITDATGNSSSFCYDEFGNMISATDFRGYTTLYSYDTHGNLINSTDPTGNVTKYTYDIVGRLIKVTDANGHSTRFVYDNNDRLVKKIDPLGHETVYNYNAVGALMSITDANGHRISYESNVLGRVSGITDASGNKTSYIYDKNGNLVKIINANNGTTTITYDALGRIISITDPLGNTERYEYDAVGNLIKIIDANGNTVTYTYDALNRIVKITDNKGYTITYSYDATGNIIKIQDSEGYSAIYEYDELNRLVSVTVNYYGLFNKTISYTYDANGNRLSMVDPDGGVTRYEYDANNRITKIIDPSGDVTTYIYDNAGRRIKVQHPNGVITEYSYDAADRLLSLVNKKSSGEVISSYTYTYDNVGNRLSVRDKTGNITYYEYDDLYRLVRVVYPSGEVIRYSYDALGNRLTKIDSASTITYTYDADNRLLTAGTTKYYYDNNGNLIKKVEGGKVTIYEYDTLNRLVRVILPNGETISYKYAPTGERISRTDSNGTIYYLYDLEDVLMELNETGTVTVRYTHGSGIDEPISMLRGGTKFYYLFDGLGSVTSLTDINENVVATYEYYPFGKIRKETGNVVNPYRFTGREYDDSTGLYYYRARYYDAEVGRFLSKDPLGLGKIFENNLYIYSLDNPINYVDPTGHFYFKGMIASVMGFIGGVLMTGTGLSITSTGIGAPIGALLIVGGVSLGGMSVATLFVSLALPESKASEFDKMRELMYSAASQMVIPTVVHTIMQGGGDEEFWKKMTMYNILHQAGVMIISGPPKSIWELISTLYTFYEWGEKSGINSILEAISCGMLLSILKTLSFGSITSIEGWCTAYPEGPIPLNPGGDKPDDSYDVSTSDLQNVNFNYEQKVSVAVLQRGFYKNLASLLDDLDEPYTIVDVNVPLESLNDYPVFIIPSGGLYGLDSLASFKSKLEQYVSNGGTLIVFSQQHGYEFKALPGGEISGFGWLEDQSCHYRSVAISTYHPILSALTSVTSDVNVDGYFTKWPKNATVLLSRTKNGMPVLLMYRYGNGTVIASTVYTDWAYGHYQATRDGKQLIRNMIIFAKEPVEIPEYGSGDSIEIPVKITSYVGLDTEKVSFAIIGPDGKLVDRVNVGLSVLPYESKIINFSYTAPSKYGIFHIDYSLIDDEYGEVQRVHDVKKFVVSKYAENPEGFVYQGKDITFSVVSDSEYYVYGSNATFTILIWNRGDADKNVTCWWSFPHDYWARHDPIYGSPGTTCPGHRSNLYKTLSVPAHGEVSFEYSVPVYSFDRLWADFYEGDNTSLNYLGKASRGFYVLKPSVHIDLRTDKIEYGRGENVSILLNIENRGFLGTKIAIPLNVTVKTTIYNTTMPYNKNRVFENSFDLNLNPYQVFSRTLNFTAEECCSHLVLVNVYHNGNVIGSNGTYFRIVRPYTIDVSFNKPDNTYSVRENMEVEVEVTNVKLPSWSSNVTLSIPALNFEEKKYVQLNLNQTETVSFNVSIPPVPAGKYDVNITIDYDNNTFYRYFIIPDSKLILSAEKADYSAGEYLNINLTNAGGVDTAYNCLIKFSGSGFMSTNYSQGSILAGETKTITLEIPEQITHGWYNLEMICKDLNTGKRTSLWKSYTVDGLKADLTSITDKKAYFSYENISILTNVVNKDGDITNATLNLKIYSPSRSLPGELTAMTVYEERKRIKSFLDYLIPSAAAGFVIPPDQLPIWEKIWEKNITLNLDELETKEIVTNLSIPDDLFGVTGRLKLEATLYNSLNQVINSSYHYFFITNTNTSLTLETDKEVYKPGEVVTIFGEVQNNADLPDDYVLTIRKDGMEIYSDYFTLNPGETYSFTTNTTAVYSFTLEGSVFPVTGTEGEIVTSFIRVEPAVVNISIIAPDVVGIEPFNVSILVQNVGNVEAELNVSVGNKTWNLTIPEKESMLLETSMSINENTTLNVTVSGDVNRVVQKEIIFGENATINIDPLPVYPEGVVEIPYTIENTGMLDSKFNATFTIGDYVISKSFFIPKGENVTDRLSFNLARGKHFLQYISPFEELNVTIDVQSPPELVITSILPENKSFTLGQNVTITFKVRNNGGTDGEASITLLMPDFEDTNRTWIGPKEEKEISFDVIIPDDLAEGKYKAIYELNGEKGEFYYYVYGANISVDASLDKHLYEENETAIFTLNITNECPLNLSLYARVKLGEYEETRHFNLTDYNSLQFEIPVSFNQKLFYGIYMESGRALYLNAMYVHKKELITLYTDKQVYNTGETVTVFVEAENSGLLNITAPGYSAEVPVNGSTVLSFTVPELRSGTYYIEYTFDNFSSSYPFDVIGYSARIIECSLDKDIYNQSDVIKINMNVETNKNISGVIKFWIYDLQGNTVDSFSVNKTLVEGENKIEVSREFSAGYGMYTLVYAVYAGDLMLASGAEYFDVGEAGNIPPVADANGPYEGVEGQQVQFDGSGSYDPEGEQLTYYWDFGDGESGEGMNPMHVYAQDGTYNVTLTVSDGMLNSTSTTIAVIADTGPIANFTTNITSGSKPLVVQFYDNSTSYDGIVAWEWDFNGDGIVDSNEQNPIYTYDEAGTYTVSLTVYEADGDSNTETKTDYITVTSAVDTEPPTIESVTLDTYINIPNSSFHVTVEATDNVGIASVTADGVTLTKTGNTWEGDIFIPEGTPEGEYTLTITAQDEAGNTAESSVNYSVVFPQGGFTVAIDPMMSSASAGDVKVYQIKIISNENFDDKLHVYISDEGIPDAYKANFSFNWTDKTIYLKSGETVELSLEVTIPQASGYKMFRVYADSMRFRTYGYCTGIVLIS